MIESIAKYAEEQVREFTETPEEEPLIEAAFVEFLVALRHLADLRNFDFFRMLDKSYDRYLLDRKFERGQAAKRGGSNAR